MNTKSENDLMLELDSCAIHHLLLSYYTHSSDISKKDLLLMYLLSHRRIMRYQVYRLLQYEPDKYRGADELINRLCRDGLSTKTASGQSLLLDFLSLTVDGIAAAAEISKREIQHLIQSNLSFAKRYVAIINKNGFTVDGCYQYLKKRYKRKRKFSAEHIHQLAVNDSYITLVLNSPPGMVAGMQYEVEYSGGLPFTAYEQLYRGLYQPTEIRSDALITMTLPGTDEAKERVIVEQDTGSQSGTIITSKLNRYRDNIISPWLSTKEAPPLLLFSLLTPEREGTPNTGGCTTKGRYLLSGVELLSAIYSDERDIPISSVKLNDILSYLRQLSVRTDMTDEYQSFVESLVSRYGSGVLVVDVKEMYLKGKDNASGRDAIVRYMNRRRIIFSSVDASEGWKSLMLRGVSVATCHNNNMSSLLGLFPKLYAEDTISRSLASMVDRIEGYSPYVTYSLQGGGKIVMRNHYKTVKGEYVVENVGDDYGGYCRVVTLLQEPSLPCGLILTMNMEDVPVLVPQLKAAAGMHIDKVYLCHYSLPKNGVPAHNNMIRLSQL